MEPCILEEALAGIKALCISRHYKCNGCPYYIKKVAPDAGKYISCIFANIPCDWNIKDKEVKK